MNDRFRFRVWDKNHKVYFGGDYGVSYYLTDSEIDGDLYCRQCDGPFELSEDDDFIVEQCTGLKDKNGNLIYEGDIIGGVFQGLYIDWCDECKQFCLKNPLGECMSCLGDMHWCDLVEDDGKIEIVGNIHENKELLNER